MLRVGEYTLKTSALHGNKLPNLHSNRINIRHG